jgi:phage-related protein
MPPIVLAPATLLGENTVVNSGDADAYPVWTIHGPGQPTITNQTTGRSFGLNVTLSSDEVVVVDTRPTFQSAIDQDNNDRWNDLLKSSPRDLWSLAPGTNDLSLSLTGSDAESKIVLSYTRRWLRS